MQPINRKTIRLASLALFATIVATPRIGLCVDDDVTQIYTYLNGWYWKFLLPIGITLAGFVIMYGGITYAMSGGDPTKAGRGKELIYGAISGLVLLILAVFIVKAITT